MKPFIGIKDHINFLRKNKCWSDNWPIRLKRYDDYYKNHGYHIINYYNNFPEDKDKILKNEAKEVMLDIASYAIGKTLNNCFIPNPVMNNDELETFIKESSNFRDNINFCLRFSREDNSLYVYLYPKSITFRIIYWSIIHTPRL